MMLRPLPHRPLSPRPQPPRGATDPFLQGLPVFDTLLSLVAEALRRRQIRRSYGRLPEPLLRDIGLSRPDLDVALALPLSCDADQALHHLADRPSTW